MENQGVNAEKVINHLRGIINNLTYQNTLLSVQVQELTEQLQEHIEKKE